MAKLTTKVRARIPTSKFAGPNRSYPIEDRAHAANAKARAKQMLDAGKLSHADYLRIVARANAVLNRGK